MAGEFRESLAGTSALHDAELMDSMYQTTVRRRKTEPSDTIPQRQLPWDRCAAYKCHTVYYGEAALRSSYQESFSTLRLCAAFSVIWLLWADRISCIAKITLRHLLSRTGLGLGYVSRLSKQQCGGCLRRWYQHSSPVANAQIFWARSHDNLTSSATPCGAGLRQTYHPHRRIAWRAGWSKSAGESY